MKPWIRFWCWYDRHFNKTLWITFIILVIQIPHFIWGGDALFKSGYVYNQNLFTDVFLYSIDLIEIPLIINTTMQIYSKYVRKLSQNNTD